MVNELNNRIMQRRYNDKQMQIVNNTISNINNAHNDIVVYYEYNNQAKQNVIIIEPKSEKLFNEQHRGFQPYNYDCCIGFLMGLSVSFDK